MTDTHDPTGDQVARDLEAREADPGERLAVAGEDAGGAVARRIRAIIEHGRADDAPR